MRSSGKAIPNALHRWPAGSPNCSCRATTFRPDHVDLFDRVLVDLVPHTEIPARADLAERMSVLANAPRTLVGRLAREDEISVAGPVLRRSPVLEEQVLIEIARMKGQSHLLAMTLPLHRRCRVCRSRRWVA